MTNTYNKFTLKPSTVNQLQKSISHKFIPIRIVEDTIKDEPLHYIRTGVHPEIVNPKILDKIIQPVPSEYPQRVREFLDLAVSYSKQWIKGSERDVFFEYLYTDKPLHEIASDFNIDTFKLTSIIRRIKQLLYVHFAEDFDIQVVPDEWKSPYVPIEVTDDCTTFIPGKSYRS